MKAVDIFGMFQTVFDTGKTSLDKKYSRMPSIKKKKKRMNKTSTGDLQGRVRSKSQRMEPGGDQDGVANLT